MFEDAPPSVAALDADSPDYVIDPPIESVVFGWGANEDGQLGIEQDAFASTPRVVEALLGRRLRGRDFERTPLISGSRISIAVEADGQLWSWGWNERGTLGHGERGGKEKPRRIAALKGVKVVQVAVGGWHTLALDEVGQVYSWGGNEYYQCGVNANKQDIIKPVPCIPEMKVQQVACGGMHSLALTTDGNVWMWGERWGEFSLKIDRTPKRVEGAENIVKIVCGAFHNLALNQDGEVFTWGTNDYGQLGNGSTVYQVTPKKVVDLEEICIADVAAGGWHSVALSSAGEVYVWGRGEYGRLGLGDRSNSSRLRPHKVPYLDNHRIVQACAGGTHTLCLTDTGRIFIWGRGSFGRLGTGILKNQYAPVEVELPGGSSRWHVIAVSSGGRHSLVLALPVNADLNGTLDSPGSEDVDEGVEQSIPLQNGNKALVNDPVPSSSAVLEDASENKPVNGNTATTTPPQELDGEIEYENVEEVVWGGPQRIGHPAVNQLEDSETPRSEISLRKGIMGGLDCFGSGSISEPPEGPDAE